MINVMILALEKCDIPFETHTFNVLQKYDSTKCTTSLHQFLKFRYDQRTTMALESHDYPKLNMTFLDHKTEIGQKKNYISRGVDRALIGEGQNCLQTGKKNFVSVSNIINAAEIPIYFEKTLLMYKHGSFSTLF